MINVRKLRGGLFDFWGREGMGEKQGKIQSTQALVYFAQTNKQDIFTWESTARFLYFTIIFFLILIFHFFFFFFFFCNFGNFSLSAFFAGFFSPNCELYYFFLLSPRVTGMLFWKLPAPQPPSPKTKWPVPKSAQKSSQKEIQVWNYFRLLFHKATSLDHCLKSQ